MIDDHAVIEALDRRGAPLDVGGLRVVDEPDAANLADRLERVLETGEPFDRPRHRLRRRPRQSTPTAAAASTSATRCATEQPDRASGTSGSHARRRSAATIAVAVDARCRPGRAGHREEQPPRARRAAPAPATPDRPRSAPPSRRRSGSRRCAPWPPRTPRRRRGDRGDRARNSGARQSTGGTCRSLSSWKLLTSTTWIVSVGRVVHLGAERRRRCSRRPAPGSPPASSIRPVSVVVVDLPFVPVIATTRPRSHREASSSSPIIGDAGARAASIAGCSGGTPGLSTIRSASAERARAGGRRARASTPALRSRSRLRAIGARVSVSVTRAPRRDQQFRGRDAAARRARRPSTRLPATENCAPGTSSQLQRRQAEEREDDREDHEARDDLRLAPADQLEVVVDRRHPEDALAGRA